MILEFDVDTVSAELFLKDGQALCQGLESKYRVTAKIDTSQSPKVVITTLTESEAKATQLFDKVSDYCECRGIGRIIEHDFFVSSVTDLSEYSPDTSELDTSLNEDT